ncbi:RloB family protein [Mycolicibacterium elephantis]
MSPRGGRSGGRRKVTQRATKFEIQVFAEGLKTENTYITYWHREYREKINVVIAPHVHSAPLPIVEMAVAAKKHDEKEARRDRGKPYDEYWCIFDIDQHENVREALELAAANDIKVALSSPCLELWFLLHFQDQTAHIDHRAAQSKAYEAIGCTKSALTQDHVESFCAQYDSAKRRACALTKKHHGDGADRPWNPWSNVWELVDTIRATAPISGSGVPFRIEPS